MDFFRKYQRPILFTAGIFALVTFSIAGPVMDTAQRWFSSSVELPTLEIDGKKVQLQSEDYTQATRVREILYNSTPGVIMNVLPRLDSPQADGSDETRDVLAALRRIAIESGIESSYEEVDRVIANTLDYMNRERSDDEKLDAESLSGPFRSEEILRDTIYEGLRIATLVRLSILATDTTDAGLATEIAKSIDKVDVEAVFLSEKKFEDSVREAFEAMDEAAQDQVLMAHLESLDPGPRRAFEDVNRHRVEFFGFRLPDVADRDALVAKMAADGLVDLGETEPANWQEAISDDEVQAFIERSRDTLYAPAEDDGEENGEGEDQDGEGDGGESADATTPEGGETAPDETTPDETGSDEAEAGEDGTDADGATPAPIEPDPADVRFRLIVARALQTLRDQFEARIDEYRDTARDAVDESLTAVAMARIENDLAMVELAASRGASGIDSSNYKAAKEVVKSATKALTAAEEALQTAREAALMGFDSQAVWNEIKGDATGDFLIRTEEELTLEQLKEFEPIGGWALANRIENVRLDAPVASEIYHSKPAVFGARLIERTERPLKPLADIRDEAIDSYATTEARTQVEDTAAAFESKVDELARALIQTEIDELEASKEGKVDEQFNEWVQEQEAERAALVARLEALPAAAARRARQALVDKVDAVDAALADRDSRRQEYADLVDEEVDAEIEELVDGKFDDVFAGAAEATGLELMRTGLTPLDLRQNGRSQWTYSDFTQSIFFSSAVTQLKEKGDQTNGFVEYRPRKARVWARVVEKVEGGLEDVTVYQLRRKRQDVESRLRDATWQSFSLDALKECFNYDDPRNRTEEVRPQN